MRLLRVLLAAAALSTAAAQGLVTDYASLQAAVAAGGTYTVKNHITITASLVVTTDLTLTGACSGLCVLDATGHQAGHFTVYNPVSSNGALLNSVAADQPFALITPVALSLTGLTIKGSLRGLNGEPCFGSMTPGAPTTDVYTTAVPGLARCESGLAGDDPAQAYYNQTLPLRCGTYQCGAVIAAQHTYLSVSGCSFENNAPSVPGEYAAMGAAISIINTDGFSITSSNFSGNNITAKNYNQNFGGAISVSQPYSMVGQPVPQQGTISDCTFTDNNVVGSGGALFLSMGFGTVVVSDSTFTSNVAYANGIKQTGMGGAVYLQEQYHDMAFWAHANTLAATGNASYFSDLAHLDTSVDIDGDTGSDTSATFRFHMNFNAHTKFIFDTCTFLDNSAQSLNGADTDSGLQGGAIAALRTPISISIRHCTFIGNYASQGGAIWYGGTSRILYQAILGAFAGYPLFGLQYLLPSSEVAAFNAFYGPLSVSQRPRDYMDAQEQASAFHFADYESLASLADVTGYMLSIVGGTFENNFAITGTMTAAGGALYAACGETNVTGGTQFTGNYLVDATATAFLTAGGAAFASNICPLSTNLGPDVMRHIQTKLNFVDASFSLNQALGKGGAVAAVAATTGPGGYVSLTVGGASVFSGNGASAAGTLLLGGGVYAETDAIVTLSGATFTNNSAAYGGAIYIVDASLSSNSLSLSSNTAVHAGGAIYSTAPVAFADASSTLTGNSALLGGGLYAVGGANLTGTRFVGNSASGALAAGGGACLDGGVTSLASVNFTGNYVASSITAANAKYGNGGALVVTCTGAACAASLSATQSSFTNNSAYSGGAVYANAPALSASFSATAFSNNAATLSGGAMQLAAGGSAALLAGTSLTGNSAPSGGAVAVSGPLSVSLQNVGASSNIASFGAVVFVSNPDATVSVSGASGASNAASVAGGFVFLSGSAAAASVSTLLPLGSPLTGSAAEAYGPATASVPKTTVVLSGGSEVSAEAPLLARTAHPMPTVSIALLDAFNQTVSSWPNPIQVSLVAPDNLEGLSGTLHAAYVDGAATFSTLEITDVIGVIYNISYTVSSPGLGLLDGAVGYFPVAIAPCLANEVFEASTKTCRCAAGFSYDAASTFCVPCVEGTVSVDFEDTCMLCPARTFWKNTTTCAECPFDQVGLTWSSSSPIGSVWVGNCTCGFGFFPKPYPGSSPAIGEKLLVENSTDAFECHECPEGGFCDSSVSIIPLAQEGFWHPPCYSDEFFDCEEERCEAEYKLNPETGIVEGASIEPIGGCNETGTWPAMAEEPPAESVTAEEPPAEAGMAGAPPAEASAARRRLLEVEGEGGSSCLPWEQRVDNCRCGHTGPVCGVCKEGWALAGDLCVQCTASEAFVNWPRARLAGFLFIMFFIFLVLSIALLWDELLFALALKSMPEAVGRLRSLASVKGKGAETPTLMTRLSRLAAVIGFCQPPLMMMTENLQIISSFKKLIVLQWPLTFRKLIGDLEFFNFSFLTLPPAACATPRVPLLRNVNGIALSVALLLLYILLLWGSARVIMKKMGFTPERITKFDRKTTLRYVTVLQLTYAPIVEAVLSVFNCRHILYSHYLREDVSQFCTDGTYRTYQKAAVFWVIVFVVGTPVTFYSLLHYYNVPAVARELQKTAFLKALVSNSRARRIPQPDVDFHTLSADSFPDELTEALFQGYFPTGEEAELKHAFSGRLRRSMTRSLELELNVEARSTEADKAKAAHGEHSAHGGEPSSHPDEHSTHGSAKGGTPPRPVAKIQALLLPTLSAKYADVQTKLEVLLKYARAHLLAHEVTWLHALGDPRLEGAEAAIEPLFAETFADKWYWCLVECVNKVLFTGVLAFIAPGRDAQVVAGLFLTLGLLLFYLRELPYVDRAYRAIGFFMALELSLFFILALIIKATINVVPDNEAFYDVTLTIVLISVFTVPCFILSWRLRWPIGEEEEEEEEEKEEEEEAEHEKEKTRRLAVNEVACEVDAPSPLSPTKTAAVAGAHLELVS